MPMNKPHLEFHRPTWTMAGRRRKAIRLVSSRRSWRAISMRGVRRKPFAAAAVRAGRLHDRTVRPRPLGGSSSAVGRSHGRQRRQGPGRRVVPGAHLCVPSTRAYHGPFKSEGGCMLFEIHYYDESACSSASCLRGECTR